ncbi:MAG: 2OG-Fe(II) oxygenase [Vicinamibacteria bacterium]
MPRTTLVPPERPDLVTRLAALDWRALEASLWAHGHAETAPLLTPDECAQLAASYDDESRFRSRVEMARHRFGEGEYKYFSRPLPRLVEALRSGFYPPLAVIANRWQDALAASNRYPLVHQDLLEQCHAAGQDRPTPLILRYRAGGYNCLHQDLYGDVAFPFQVMLPLSRHGVDFTGGEFLLVEQRPRAQSAGEVLCPAQGAAVIFTTRVRPARGRSGFHRVQVRHGVSRVRSGTRMALGIIFHDAR